MCDAMAGSNARAGSLSAAFSAFGIERCQAAGSVGEGGGGRRVAAQRRDAGQPAQGVGQVGGGGQSAS